MPEDDDNLLQLPRTCSLLSQRELDITENYDSVELLEKIHAREYTSVEVTTAFCKVSCSKAENATHTHTMGCMIT